jgi:biotin transport system substrate-specific component
MTRISRPYIVVWTIVGVLLTIGANFLPAYVISSPLQWLAGGVTAYSLGFKCQVGAVLLVSCLGGRTAGVLAQVAYLLLGLMWLKIFNEGGGIEYLQKPVFGYLLAFIPGAWVCGQLAFKRSTLLVGSSKISNRSKINPAPTPRVRLEYLGLSCFCGLITIHLIGIIYLVLFKLVNMYQSGNFKLLESIINYSVYPLFSQVVLACTATLIAFVLRRVMFY